jgi:hypothetical protein
MPRETTSDSLAHYIANNFYSALVKIYSVPLEVEL